LRWWPFFLLLPACTGPSTTDATDVAGDDDDTVGDDDDDCAGTDADDDGSNACDDCDDTDPARTPGAVERCDEIDNDCDGTPADGEGPACVACDESGYWADTRGVTGDALVAALHELSSDQTCRDYQTERLFLFTVLDKESDGTVECVYTGRRVAVGSTEPDATDMNTEHTWPQSLGADFPPMECDLHHLYPSDADTNARRGNLPFGEVVSVDDTFGDSLLGDDARGTLVFEPRDEHKGNVARSMLYFAMRYGYDTDPGQLAVYRSWHELDPPDAREVERTRTIADRQGEANPFVVCPELVDAL
jgi:deoxyribonuclease-1